MKRPTHVKLPVYLNSDYKYTNFIRKTNSLKKFKRVIEDVLRDKTEGFPYEERKRLLIAIAHELDLWQNIFENTITEKIKEHNLQHIVLKSDENQDPWIAREDYPKNCTCNLLN